MIWAHSQCAYLHKSLLAQSTVTVVVVVVVVRHDRPKMFSVYIIVMYIIILYIRPGHGAILYDIYNIIIIVVVVVRRMMTPRRDSKSLFYIETM